MWELKKLKYNNQRDDYLILKTNSSDYHLAFKKLMHVRSKVNLLFVHTFQ